MDGNKTRSWLLTLLEKVAAFLTISEQPRRAPAAHCFGRDAVRVQVGDGDEVLSAAEAAAFRIRLDWAIWQATRGDELLRQRVDRLCAERN